jgi:serine/threonine protein phosphatase 1
MIGSLWAVAMTLEHNPFLTRRSTSLPSGERIYAIGDIHGRADLLERMASRIKADLHRRPLAGTLTVFLGDYVDRGPDSAAVIERLVRQDFPTPIVTLRGNHEQMMLDAMSDPDDLANWVWNGGDATARSYVSLATTSGSSSRPPPKHLSDVVPATHVSFLRNTRLSYTSGDYFFCHAGIRPGVSFEAQTADDLLWIREPFHRSTINFGKVVVHGHTPVFEPESLPNRINIDTGAFRTGILTCVVLEASTRRFLAVHAD